MLTGIIGAMIATPLLNAAGREGLAGARLRGRHRGARHRHGARVPGHPMAGAFAGLAMGLNGLVTAVLLPLLWRVF